LVPEGQFLKNVRDSRVELDSASISEEEEEVEGAAKAEIDRRDKARVIRENRILNDVGGREDGSKGGLMSRKGEAVCLYISIPPPMST
jgi:hypothetical protein